VVLRRANAALPSDSSITAKVRLGQAWEETRFPSPDQSRVYPTLALECSDRASPI
jgi:hypothetical protein